MLTLNDAIVQYIFYDLSGLIMTKVDRNVLP
jgi:hypothetical protein